MEDTLLENFLYFFDGFILHMIVECRYERRDNMEIRIPNTITQPRTDIVCSYEGKRLPLINNNPYGHK